MEVSVLGGGEDEDGNEIEGEEGDPAIAREVFERGYKDLRKRGEKEDVSGSGERFRPFADLQRALLLEAWKTFEEQHGTEADLAKVQEMMPTTRKRWRKAEDGSGQLEECTSKWRTRRRSTTDAQTGTSLSQTTSGTPTLLRTSSSKLLRNGLRPGQARVQRTLLAPLALVASATRWTLTLIPTRTTRMRRAVEKRRMARMAPRRVQQPLRMGMMARMRR
jgi:hypothetical protein